MSSARRGAVFFLSVATVAAVGIAGIGRIGRKPLPSWPGRVAVIGVDDSDRRQPVRLLAVADPSRRTLVEVPELLIVEVPGHGFLRAYQSFRLGGAQLVRSTLALLFDVDVPFSVVGSGQTVASVGRTATDIEISDRDRGLMMDAITRSVATWTVKRVSGERREGQRGSYISADRRSVGEAARAIGGLGTKVFFADGDEDTGGAIQGTPEPSVASAPIARSEISVDVLNATDPATFVATQTAAKLRSLGYVVHRVGDADETGRTSSVVFSRPGSEAKAVRVADDLGYPMEAIADGFPTDADVLVMLGADART